jgi:hypothetical protein
VSGYSASEFSPGTFYVDVIPDGHFFRQKKTCGCAGGRPMSSVEGEGLGAGYYEKDIEYMMPGVTYDIE